MANFASRAEFVDKTVEIIGDEKPAKDYAQIMSHVLKRKITHNHVPGERCASMGLPGSCELADMFALTFQAEVLTPRAADSFAEMQTFEAWLEKNVPKSAGLFEAEPICSKKMSNRCLAKISATNHVCGRTSPKSDQNVTRSSPQIVAGPPTLWSSA